LIVAKIPAVKTLDFGFVLACTGMIITIVAL
jgi:hypothetical protein